jgi:hypothetical protein
MTEIAVPGVTPLIPVGSRGLPSSRQTVAKAMGILQEEGLICRWPGLGYFVESKDE